MAVSDVSSLLRMQGMASGLDTDAMVKSLMFTEKLKVKRVQQDKIRMEWQNQAQVDVRSLLTTFRNKTMSILSPSTNMKASSVYNTNTITMAQSAAAVQVTASSAAFGGSNTIDYVTNIATPASVQSSGAVFTTASIASSTRLDALGFTTPIVFAGENGDTVSFTVNGNEFSFSRSDTLQNMLNTVNYSNSGVQMSYSELTGKFKVAASSTGASGSVAIQNGAGNFFGAASASGIMAGTIQNGMDALLSINGTEITRTSNIFTIDGLNYSLMASTSTPISFRVDNNVEPAVDRIKEFLKLYNELVTTLQDKLTEEKDSDYYPLTEEDKESMSETEIELWETKAKSGLLRGDRILASVLSDMRKMLYEKVTLIGKSPADIGLVTGSYKDGGMISLNETRLRSAFAANPDDVTKIFIHEGTSAVLSEKYHQSGLLTKLNDRFVEYNVSFNRAEADYNVIKLSTRINTMNDQLVTKENFFYKRFAAMEEALSLMQSQSSWLAQQTS